MIENFKKKEKYNFLKTSALEDVFNTKNIKKNKVYNKYNFFKNYNLLKPNEIYKYLNKYVIGQEKVKKILSVSIYNHFKRLILNLDYGYNIKKSNVLLIGPSGSGKTFLIQILSRLLNIPVVIVDATPLTEAGYIGEDVEDILQKLFQESDYNAIKTEMGIVYIDEVDKIGKKSTSSNKDISGEGVQQALLKFIEGTNCSVCYSGNRRNFNQDFLNINTENILFICGGAFSGLEEIISQRVEKVSVGFSKKNLIKKNFNQLLNLLENQDLVNFGLIPELIGRLPIIGILEEVSQELLTNILINSKDSILKQCNILFSIENIIISIDDDAIQLIAKKAYETKTGVRGLKSIIDNILLNVSYKAPQLSKTLKEIIIHKNIFDKKYKNPLLIHYGD